VTDFLIGAPLVIGLTYLTGWGATRLLLPEGFRDWAATVAPWLGIVQTTLVLVALGALGIGIGIASWVALGIGVVLFGVGWLRPQPRDPGPRRQRIPAIALVLIAVTVLFVPPAHRSGGLNTFTHSNNDPFAYVLTASWVQEHGLFPLPRFPLPYPSAANVYGSLVDNPRWLPIVYLAFLSSVLRLDPVRLFSLLTCFGFALQLPLVWVLGRNVMGLKKTGLTVGFLLAALGPYPTYIAFQGFLPQVFGTGFFLGSLVVLPSCLEGERLRWREGTLLALFNTGLLLSYLELVPFAAFIAAAYSVWTAARWGGWLRRLGRTAVLLGVVALASPFQTVRGLKFLWSHVMAVLPQTGPRFGWPMPASYTDVGGLLPLRPPALWLILLVALGALAVRGVAAEQPRRAFVILIPSPFLAFAALALRADYSYAFFKCVSFVYFWLPLVIGRGVAATLVWRPAGGGGRRMVRGLRWALALALASVLTNEIVATFNLGKDFARHPVPLELAALEPLRRDPRIDDVFVSGLTYWENLWASYYLGEKRIGMTSTNEYLGNATGFADEGRWRFLLHREGFRPLIGPGRRPVETVVLRAGPFVLGRLAPAVLVRLGTLALGQGLSSEGDDREEWVWVGREGEILIDWAGPTPSAALAMELTPVQNQRLRVILNGGPIDTIPVEVGGRRAIEVPLCLGPGRNRLLLRSDRDPLPTGGRRPRLVNLRVFSLTLEARPSEPADRTRSRSSEPRSCRD
jgi:hypothetical protein